MAYFESIKQFFKRPTIPEGLLHPRLSDTREPYSARLFSQAVEVWWAGRGRFGQRYLLSQTQWN
jgi:hypothetical protein